MIRCCKCRSTAEDNVLTTTDLPGSGWRCRDHHACAERVKAIVTSHRELATIMNDSE